MNEIEQILKDTYIEATKNYESINDYAIEIGVISAKSARKNSNSKKKTTIKNDITNAELMFIHEYGSPKRNLPSRPVLHKTILYATKIEVPQTLQRIEEGCFQHNWSKEHVKTELEKMCIRLQNYARNLIYRSNELTPLKPSTVLAKGSDRPLLDTGQLAKSITCRLILKSSID